ncbi:MAG: hypothetical protein WCO58_02650 [bacterium]
MNTIIENTRALLQMLDGTGGRLSFPESIQEWRKLETFFEQTNNKPYHSFTLRLDDENSNETRSEYISMHDVIETSNGIFIHGKKGGRLDGTLGGNMWSELILYFENKTKADEVLAGSVTREKIDRMFNNVLIITRKINHYDLEAGPAKKLFLQTVQPTS